LIIPKDLPSFDPPDHEMVKGAGHVNASFSGHKNALSEFNLFGKLYFYGRPLLPEAIFSVPKSSNLRPVFFVVHSLQLSMAVGLLRLNRHKKFQVISPRCFS
jgi:hypothetical protein